MKQKCSFLKQLLPVLLRKKKLCLNCLDQIPNESFNSICAVLLFVLNFKVVLSICKLMQAWEWNERIEPTNRSFVSLCYLKSLRSQNTDCVFSFALSYCTRERLCSLVDVFQSNLNALNVWFKYTTAHCKDRRYTTQAATKAWYLGFVEEDRWQLTWYLLTLQYKKQ